MHIKKPVEGTRFVVVAGGVISGVGKGVAAATIGKLFKEYGFKTTIIKVDPYINYDAGTLRPTEHGEVWVTADGGEIDQDLGTYERFLDENISRINNITTGQIYKAVIDRERRGVYLGQTVQFIPHIIDEVLDRIKQAANGYEVAVIEVGGTVGDYENAPFLYALKSLERDLGPQRVLYVLVTYLPTPDHIGEMKTKPTQQAIRLLGEHGISPDFIICRADSALDAVRRKKIVEFSHIDPDNVIAAPNVTSVYEIPLAFETQQLGRKLLACFNMTPRCVPDWQVWREQVAHITRPQHSVRVGIVGKYLNTGAHSLTDSYLSVCHALIHAAAYHGFGVIIDWIDARDFEKEQAAITQLSYCDAIVVPGGFGNQGVMGKLRAIEYVRIEHIPFLGLCYGFQLAVVEYARNVCGMIGAHTTEVDPATAYPVVTLLPHQKAIINTNTYGGTMRLGSYLAHLKSGSQVMRIYHGAGMIATDNTVAERHRHRYEINPTYIDILESKGLCFSGYFEREDGTRLMEYLELPNHPFFVATQSHPEFTSRFMKPNPLFNKLIQVAIARKNMIRHTTMKAVPLELQQLV
jgi:CTP synthase